MNILIVGDSWSKPDSHSEPFVNPFHIGEEKLPIEYYLMKKGHTVFNRGEGGRGNINSLKLADYFLKVAPSLGIEIDLIIFFNTDLSRDRPVIFPGHTYPNNLDGLTFQLFKENVRRFEIIRSYYKGKWCVVEGNAPLVDKSMLPWLDLVIEDWRSEIVGYKLPTSQWLYDYPFLETNLKVFGADAVAKEVESIEKIWDTVKGLPELFPDLSHPNLECHEKLADRILNHFNV